MIEALQLLFLLFVANGAPVLATRVLDTAGDHPIDGGRRFLDGRPLFGPSKTWRGLGVALLASTLAALLLLRAFGLAAAKSRAIDLGLLGR